MPISALTKEQKQELADLATRHKVVYEVYPAEVIIDGKSRKIGFELNLYGTHGHVPHAPTPGCEECAPVRLDLRRIGIRPSCHRTGRSLRTGSLRPHF